MNCSLFTFTVVSVRSPGGVKVNKGETSIHTHMTALLEPASTELPGSRNRHATSLLKEARTEPPGSRIRHASSLLEEVRTEPPGLRSRHATSLLEPGGGTHRTTWLEETVPVEPMPRVHLRFYSAPPPHPRCKCLVVVVLDKKDIHRVLSTNFCVIMAEHLYSRKSLGPPLSKTTKI